MPGPTCARFSLTSVSTCGSAAPGAARRLERERARDPMRMLERRLGFGIVAAARGIVNPKHLERRLIDQNLHALRHHAGNRAHGIADRGMLRNGERRAEPARDLGIVRPDRRADRDQRPGEPEPACMQCRQAAGRRTTASSSALAEHAPAGADASRPGSFASAAASSARAVSRTTCSWVRSQISTADTAADAARALRSSMARMRAPHSAASRLQPCCTAEHVHGIARREGGERREARIGQAPQRLETRAVAHQRPKPGAARDRAPPTPASPCDDRCAGASRSGLRKANWVANSGRCASSASERSSSSVRGKVCASKLSGIALRGPTLEPHLPVEAHLAVAAEAAGAHVDRLHHGAPAADQRALRADRGPAVRHHGDVGGGAAHVRDDEVADARSRNPAPTTLAAGPDRMVSTGYSSATSRPHQRAVALHDHERRIDRLLDEHLRQRLDQMPDLRREARIQHGRQRAARRIELRAQLVRAGHRLLAKARG